MKYAVEMGSSAMIFIPSFIIIGLGILKLIGGIHRQHGDLISLICLYQHEESMLKTNRSWYSGHFHKKSNQKLPE
jgi:hypothetical protein